MGEHTMEFLHFSENITRLRQAQGLTQEVLADHIGVTKASVSKWERGQSLPDAPVLAELASFFGVTLDELVGYEPQLGREQIRRIYRELAEDFAKKPFAEVMGRLPPLYPPLRQLLAVPAADGGAAAQPRAARPHAGGTAGRTR